MKLDRSCIGNPRNKEELERLRAQLTPENHIEMNGKMYILYLEGTVPSFQDIYCPTCMSIECRNPRHELFCADRDIIPILKILHAKGYKTSSSCAGHYDNYYDKYNVSIQFAGVYRLPDIDPPLKITRVEHEGKTYTTGVGMIRKRLSKSEKRDDEEHDKAIVESNLKIIRSWAEALPPVGQDEVAAEKQRLGN